MGGVPEPQQVPEGSRPPFLLVTPPPDLRIPGNQLPPHIMEYMRQCENGKQPIVHYSSGGEFEASLEMNSDRVYHVKCGPLWCGDLDCKEEVILWPYPQEPPDWTRDKGWELPDGNPFRKSYEGRLRPHLPFVYDASQNRMFMSHALDGWIKYQQALEAQQQALAAQQAQQAQQGNQDAGPSGT